MIISFEFFSKIIMSLFSMLNMIISFYCPLTKNKFSNYVLSKMLISSYLSLIPFMFPLTFSTQKVCIGRGGSIYIYIYIQIYIYVWLKISARAPRRRACLALRATKKKVLEIERGKVTHDYAQTTSWTP